MSDKEKDKKNRLDQSPSNQEIKQFLKSYEFKQSSIGEIFDIYSRHCLKPKFQNTLKSAIFLIFAPALTNIFYTFRPHGIMAGFLPITMPIFCILQYTYFLNNDFQEFCFTEEPDAEIIRQKYEILYTYSYLNNKNTQFINRLSRYRQSKLKTESQTELTEQKQLAQKQGK